ncbi:MAG: lipopolysaccharide biosynthesis protein [Bacteroidales bacterium]|nr:lipopolysaccharide biosynthesis protein [Bacteroidales bacterium]
MAKSLKHKAASGMVWTALQKYSKMGIQFISGIILARLLTPYDYGCIGMLSIFMVLAEVFIDAGFGSALIQKKRPTQEDYSTIFWWNLGMAVLMYAVLYMSAPAISRFYDIPLLCDVLRVQGLVLFIFAFNIVQRNQLKKQLNFRVLSIVSITTAIISLCITIFMAYKGFGVWALVTQNMVTAAIPAIVFWFFIKWRPMLVFSKQSFKELFGFGFYMFLTHLVNDFSGQIQGLLIGKMYTPATMGYYSKAHSTEKLASKSISQVMTQVTYPLYAEVQDDKAAMVNMIKRLTSTIAYLTFPLMFILLLIAKPLFILLYSDRWLQSVPYFQVLCIAGLAVCLQAVNLQTIPAIGKSKVMFIWTLIKRGVGLGAILLGLFFYGMKGLLCGVVFNSWFSLFINMWLVSRYIGYKMSRQLIDLLPIFVISTIAALVSFGIGLLLMIDNIYVDGLVKLGFYVLIYMGWSFIFKPDAFNYTMTVVNPFLVKIFHRK